MHISSLRWRSGGDEAAPQSGSGVSGVFAYLLQLCVLHVYLVQPALAAWYSADETVLSHGIVCHKMDQEVQLGRLCSVEQAVYQERLQTPDNRHMLGSTGLLRLLAPSLPAENNDCPAYDGINPCIINTTVRSVSFFGDYYIEPAPMQHLDMLCDGAETLAMPTVFLVRDHNQISHLLTVQLAPLIEAVKAVGWDEEPYQLVFMDRRSTHAAFGEKDDYFLPVFEHISRSTPVSMWNWPRVVCMAKALVGVGTDRMMLGHDKTKAFERQSIEEVAFNRETIHDMRDKVLGAYGILYRAKRARHGSVHQPRITIVDRGPPPMSRRIVNQDDLLAAAQQVGHAQLVVLQKLSFQDQLKLMAVTDVLIGTHGSGMAMMLFLPSCGVTVEIKAYRHGLTDDFTHGHCNLARAANRSLLVWHNKHVEHTQAWEGPDGGADYHWWKQHHTFIPDAEIGAILGAAVQAWQTPSEERNFDAVQFLNTAETDS